MGPAQRILVTGGTGFLGSYIVAELLARGDRVAVLKRAASPLGRLEASAQRLHFYATDETGVERAFSEQGGFDAVVHAATCYGRLQEAATEVFSANLAFPLRVLEAAVRFGTSAFLNLDTALPRRQDAYVLSKKQFAERGQEVAGRTGIRFVNIELQHMYGPGDDESKFTTWVIRSCRRNEPELRLTAAEQKRDFVYVEDVVSACRKLLQKAPEDTRTFQRYPVGSGQAVRVREYVELAHRMTHSRTRLVFGAVPYREDEVMYCQADLTAMRTLGWRPRFSLQDGIQHILQAESES